MESGVDITIKGAKHDKTELSGNRTNIANGESIKMEDFKHDEETDDVYTMTAVIKDKAGNETEKEVMFSVNRFGSNYISLRQQRSSLMMYMRTNRKILLLQR